MAITHDACLNEVLNIESKLISKGVQLKKGARQLLTFLKDNEYKIALATSSTRDRGVSILDKHNIIDYFDEFVFSEDVKFCKPSPEVFLKACDKMNISTNEAIVLEDSENGIKAACNADIPVICIPDMKMPEKEYLDKTISTFNSLEEVIDYLKNL